MKLLNKREMSMWAFEECRNGNDTKEMRKLITNQCDIYLYCLNVKDREEMWTKITDPTYALLYCIDVKNKPEVRKYINNSKAKMINPNYIFCYI